MKLNLITSQPWFLTLWFLTLLFSLPSQANEPVAHDYVITDDKQRIDTQVRYSHSDLSKIRGFVVFVQGSGNLSFRESGVGFEQFLEQLFFEQHYAVIYMNKRGIGKSSGNQRQISIQSRADDVQKVFNFYHETLGRNMLPGGLVGHSQGGWVVQLLANQNSNVDFAITLAGPVRTVQEQDLYRTFVDAQCSDLTSQQVTKQVDKREKALNRMQSLGKVIPFFQLKYMSNLLAHDPGKAVREISVPTLMLFAGADSMVSYQENLNRLAELFPSGVPPHIQIRLVEDSDHLFRLTDTLCFEYFRHGEFALQLEQALSSWLSQLAAG